MLIRAGYEIAFEADADLAMLVMLYVHPSRKADVDGESLEVTPRLPVREFLDCFGNRCALLKVPRGSVTFRNDCLIRDSGELDESAPEARQLDVHDLPPETLPFLLASRYCEVDCLSELAWQLFGTTPPGWPRVQAICEWVHSNVNFGYVHARPTKTAQDVCNEKAGVCRDFTHLAITFCRAMNIPARYCTGYLGDIGVPASPDPMDFSAWFEVFLEDRWYTFDARHNQRRIGRVVMARGRDAVDVALTTSFGFTRLKTFKVWTDEVSNGQPLSSRSENSSSIVS